MKEVVSTLGFLELSVSELSEFTEEMFMKRFPLSSLNAGVDLYFDKPLIARRSELVGLRKDSAERVVTHELFLVTHCVIRWLIENKINRPVIFCYKARTMYANNEIECAAFPLSETTP